MGGKVTGGGTVETAGGTKANFSMNGSNCDDPSHPTGRLNYNDRNAAGFAQNGGVKFDAALIDLGQCTVDGGCTDQSFGFCPKGGYAAHAGYTSTNPKAPGVGTVGVCLVDNGEGKNGTGDLVGLKVAGGPYDGYTLPQATVKGNIQGHACQ